MGIVFLLTAHEKSQLYYWVQLFCQVYSPPHSYLLATDSISVFVVWQLRPFRILGVNKSKTHGN